LHKEIDMAFSKQTIQAVWENGRAALDQDANVWRTDPCGAWIRRDHYGSDHSEYGWKIENAAAGGAATPENLQPVHLRNRIDRASGQPHCTVTADRAQTTPTAHVDKPRNKNA
jgi:hypothetical protein